MSKKIRCMFRLDDITPDMDWERFYQVKDILHKYDIRPLIGVVPDNRDANLHKQQKKEAFFQIIRRLQDEGWAVAQHGTYHCYETESAGILKINPFSEFAGLSYEKQLCKLKEGKAILRDNGIDTDIFMAPGHTYDKNTIKALVECGFLIVTDGLYQKPYYDGGLLFVPCRLRGFKKPMGVDTICLHTNLMTQKDMEELDAFCKNNRDVIAGFEPAQLKLCAANRTVYVSMCEKIVLSGRRIKDKIANSKRLAWYMRKTNHASSKVKWLKRIGCLPMLLFWKEEQ